MAVLVTSGPGFIGSNFRIKGATFFACHVKDPERYSMADFDGEGRVLSLEYNPIKPKSSYAVTGSFFYDERDVDYTQLIKPSSRAELEITDLNKLYLEDGELTVKKMGRGYAWLDTDTHESLLDAAPCVQTIENWQELKIACPEDIAFCKNWICAEDLENG